MSNETQIPKETPKLGVVVLLEYNKEKNVFEIIGATEIVNYGTALIFYAEIPNPASQLLDGDNFLELAQELENLKKRIINPQWVEGLLESI